MDGQANAVLSGLHWISSILGRKNLLPPQPPGTIERSRGLWLSACQKGLDRLMNGKALRMPPLRFALDFFDFGTQKPLTPITAGTIERSRGLWLSACQKGFNRLMDGQANAVLSGLHWISSILGRKNLLPPQPPGTIERSRGLWLSACQKGLDRLMNGKALRIPPLRFCSGKWDFSPQKVVPRPSTRYRVLVKIERVRPFRALRGFSTA